MRTILFRAKRFDINEFVEGYYFETPLTDGSTDSTPDSSWSFLTGKKRHVISRNSCVYQVLPDTLGQFTGLTDKNGKRIFEGDIYHQGDTNITYTVVWNECCIIGKQNGTSSFAGINYWLDRIEVVGNIHDNPELLR